MGKFWRERFAAACYNKVRNALARLENGSLHDLEYGI